MTECSDAKLLFAARLQESIDVKAAMLADDSLMSQAAAVAGLIVEALRDDGKVLLFGNGGSATDATHIAAEFVGRFKLERRPLPAISLTDNTSAVSAIANDYDYEQIFSRQIVALGRPGDVALGLTTSGMSKNVVQGLRAAAAHGRRTVVITGASGGSCAAAAQLCLRLPSDETSRVQEAYMVLCHSICEWVEQQFVDP